MRSEADNNMNMFVVRGMKRQAMLYFVFNTGSSSVKISLLSLDETRDKNSPDRLIVAHAENLLTDESIIHVKFSVDAIKKVLESKPANSDQSKKIKSYFEQYLTASLKDKMMSRLHTHETGNLNHKDSLTITTIKVHEWCAHKWAIELIMDEIRRYDEDLLPAVCCVGHRVVHGGQHLKEPSLVDSQLIASLDSISHLAPLHNPSNMLGMWLADEVFQSTIPSVAVFDTAFHATIPEVAHTYPLPEEYRQCQIRKYGFHGTSVKYVSEKASRILSSYGKSDKRLIICHLGNGASVTAVVDGKSVDTTMEFTPMTGLMMGTRSGSIDPTVVTFAAEQLNKDPKDVINDLNKHSGLKAMSKGDHDMRVITERATKGDRDAMLALNMFVYTLSKHIASMAAACSGPIDALVFTAGIGENSAVVRDLTVNRISALLGGVMLDDALNVNNGAFSAGVINRIDDKVQPWIMVIPTDEEAMICLECHRFLAGS